MYIILNYSSIYSKSVCSNMLTFRNFLNTCLVLVQSFGTSSSRGTSTCQPLILMACYFLPTRNQIEDKPLPFSTAVSHGASIARTLYLYTFLKYIKNFHSPHLSKQYMCNISHFINKNKT